MSDCFDYSSDDTEDDDQYGEEEINCNEYDGDDFYNSDDQYSGRNQLSDYAIEGTNRTDSEEESFNSNVVDSPGGKTKLWKPIVPKDFMSDVDAIYQSLEEAVEMYKLYADKTGFGVRESQPPLETKEERRYSKCARRLSYKDKEFIVRSSTSNIGATKAHKLQASLQGGYENIGPEAIDYKNFRRKVGNIIGDKDAQLVVDKMNMMKDELHNYTFEYKCVDSVLNAMFWADETDKLYYKEFGDVISFDATFRTNKIKDGSKTCTWIENFGLQPILKTCHYTEIFKAAWYCSIDIVEKIDGWQVVMITQTDKSKQVELKLPEKEVKCSCNHFIRTGILCCHIFAVLKNNHIEEIPEQYILRRWRMDATMEFGSSNQTSFDNDEEEIIRMLGIRSIPDEINIHQPASICTKGSGTKKRMVSAIEKVVVATKTKTRMCTGCNQYVNHNWRTCKVRLARESKAA
ncbi:unnamed protein product [Lactuca saligna]|uniref:SWIM-type domain-containing protein n=1 Tax=Lactuca saligna TaxID=75948 RepID=A0AA35Z5N3_LACSI|nr:unnamed protein product [Lactuca saligna]